MRRDLYLNLWKELNRHKSMVFLSGPRQAGKTTLAKEIASEFKNNIYFNWDFYGDQKKILEQPPFFETAPRLDASIPLVIFDEIHKYRKWKNYIKGIYDVFNDRYRFLILGSGRLNVFQRGGDSMAGRYFQFHLWPMTLAELGGKRLAFPEFIQNPLHFLEESAAVSKTWKQLSRLSGFPEPFLSGEEKVYRIWASRYRQQLVREDIRNMNPIKDLSSIEILSSLLPSKIGSPLSTASLARDLQVSFNAVKKWLQIFESFFMIFFVSPWSKKMIRSLTKEKKMYLFDYADIPSEAARFENMVAVELLRAVSNWNDSGLGDFDLHYLRNREKEEVDFLISKNREPFLLIETKLSEENVSKGLLKFQNQLGVSAVQLVENISAARLISNGRQSILITSPQRWLPLLP